MLNMNGQQHRKENAMFSKDIDALFNNLIPKFINNDLSFYLFDFCNLLAVTRD